MNNHFTAYGGFFYIWSSFDSLLEIICQRRLGITARQANIVFATLNASAKADIAVALLLEEPQDQPLADLIREIPKIAKRNHIMHSIYRGSPDLKINTFEKREINKGLKVKTLKFEEGGMKEHFDTVLQAILELQRQANISDDDLEAYHEAAKT